jgi:hypothetical protein
MLRDFLGTQALLLDLVIDCRLLGGFTGPRLTARPGSQPGRPWSAAMGLLLSGPHQPVLQETS